MYVKNPSLYIGLFRFVVVFNIYIRLYISSHVSALVLSQLQFGKADSVLQIGDESGCLTIVSVCIAIL